jgi:RNA polymerase sigma-70 factor (ECF subfamily)
MVCRLLTRLLGDPDDAKDLTQDTFVTLLRRVGTLRDAAQLRSFIVSIAIRLARNELRKRRVRAWIGLDEVSEPLLSEPHDAVTAQRVRSLYAALSRMDADARTLFVLRHAEGVELLELAQVTGCSLATVKRRLRRAEARFAAIAGGDAVLAAYFRPDVAIRPDVTRSAP